MSDGLLILGGGRDAPVGSTHTWPCTQNPNEFEVRFTPDATYSSYKLKMHDPTYFDWVGMVSGRDLTLTISKHPDSFASAGLLSCMRVAVAPLVN